MLSSSARSTQTTVVGSRSVRCFAQPGAVNTMVDTRKAAMMRPGCAGGAVLSMRWGLADSAVPHAAAMAGAGRPVVPVGVYDKAETHADG